MTTPEQTLFRPLARPSGSPDADALVGVNLMSDSMEARAPSAVRVSMISPILSINELVGIAVLAAFASGDYKTAGLVAFFMLMHPVGNPPAGPLRTLFNLFSNPSRPGPEKRMKLFVVTPSLHGSSTILA